MVPVIAWILAALGVTTVVGSVMGFIIPLITVAFLVIMSLVFLSKAVEFKAVSDDIIIPGILVMLALASAGYALFIINPAIFEQTVSLSVAGSTITNSISSQLSSGSMLAVTNIEESPIGSLGNDYKLGYFLLTLLALGFILTNIKTKKIKRR